MMKELPCELCAPAKSCAGDVPATPFLLQAGQGKQEVGIFRMFFKTWRTKKGHLPWPSSFSCLSSGFGLPCQWPKNRQEKPALCDMVSEGNRIQFFVPSEDYWNTSQQIKKDTDAEDLVQISRSFLDLQRVDQESLGEVQTNFVGLFVECCSKMYAWFFWTSIGPTGSFYFPL